ncbi:hypothetical protein [Vibrio phage VpV262]|uniref:Uncharacterized protein n=1 Tax=Vibrio phage VpV262 TaxID=2907796 RepID=Q8LT86_9CAUD|nr:hypothetical protein VpV262p13 [Vibrio phage VpV262]AAM28361.1 hypothetical protein [Vibrio phage VpV262]
MRHQLHPLTLEYTRLAVQDLLQSARTKVLREFTCLEIKSKVKSDLKQYATDLTEGQVYAQMELVGDIMVELAKEFCEDMGIPYHYSFVERHIDEHAKSWDASHRACDACIGAGEHALRVSWLLHLQDDIGA